jgi:hypothetical protein
MGFKGQLPELQRDEDASSLNASISTYRLQPRKNMLGRHANCVRQVGGNKRHAADHQPADALNQQLWPFYIIDSGEYPRTAEHP